MNSIRILHCPAIVGGNAPSLARAERELGLDSRAVILHQAELYAEVDEVLFSPSDNILRRGLKRWHLLQRALNDFDIIHFNFGESLMQRWIPSSVAAPDNFSQNLWPIYQSFVRLLELRDLPLLKKAGKGVLVTYQGDDARQGDVWAKFEAETAGLIEPGYYAPDTDRHKRYRIARFAGYADRIYALNPDLLRVLPPQAQFLPYGHIDLRAWRPKDEPPFNLAKPVIVHAPTHRGIKGTDLVIEAIAQLQAEGVALEFVLVEGLTQQEARQIYQGADLLIDQLLVGWYGGLAVEFMALGKPVICYIREDDLKFIPPAMRQDLPIIRATAATLYQILKQWLTRRKSELPQVGRKSRTYVETWHDPLKIAARLKHDYETLMN